MSNIDEISALFEGSSKEKIELVQSLKEKDITGREITVIAKIFAPLIRRLELKEEANQLMASSPLCSLKLLYGKSVDMSYSDSNDFNVQPSIMDTFSRIPQDFYQTLDEALESAAFYNTDKIRKESQEKIKSLEESGTLSSLGISKEEAEVLFSYTYDDSENGHKYLTPFLEINKCLAERNSNATRKYRGYILHLLKALRKLKPVKTAGVTLYRGIDGKNIDLLESYKEGSTRTWPGFTSTSTSQRVVYKQFIRDVAHPIIFEIHGNFTGYDISPMSKYPDENETLLEPETSFKILSVWQDAIDPRIKRVKVVVQKTPLVADEAVKNFRKRDEALHPAPQSSGSTFSKDCSQFQPPPQISLSASMSYDRPHAAHLSHSFGPQLTSSGSRGQIGFNNGCSQFQPSPQISLSASMSYDSPHAAHLSHSFDPQLTSRGQISFNNGCSQFQPPHCFGTQHMSMSMTNPQITSPFYDSSTPGLPTKIRKTTN